LFIVFLGGATDTRAYAEREVYVSKKLFVAKLNLKIERNNSFCYIS